jgi:nucleoside-diphosphate-sugar epimerase
VIRKALVTGAGGFVGRHTLAPLRRAGFEVHAVSRRARPAEPGVTWHRADLRTRHDLTKRLGPSHLLHLAWTTEHGKYWQDPANADWLDASRRLLDDFVAAGGRRAVVAGTCAEYDWSAGLCDEASTPLRCTTPYSQAKHALHEHLQTLPISTAWGRLFFAFGPGEPATRLIPSVIRSLHRGVPAETSEGLQERDFIAVEDAGTAFAALLDAPVTGAVNLGSGQAVAVRQLVEDLGRAMGRPELIRLGARPGSDEPPRVVAAVDRLHREVGFRPRLSREEALRRSIEHWTRLAD